MELDIDGSKKLSVLNSLKPLGLAAVLNNKCNLRKDMQLQYREGVTSEPEGCLCLLGKEIGFDVGAVRLCLAFSLCELFFVCRCD